MRRKNDQQTDLLRELGELALGSRLKRLRERMDNDISGIYQTLGIDFKAKWFSTLYLLRTQPSMSITGVAECLGFSHPAVNKIAAEMVGKGLLVSNTDKKDRRRRVLKLTRKGRTIADYLGPVWDEVRFVVGDLIGSVEHNLLEAIEGIEERRDEKEMYERIFERLKLHRFDEIEIVDYRPNYMKHFESLNRAWMEGKFRIEKHDAEMLSDPFENIIKPGGAVIFAKLGRKIVGTCALLRHENGVFELAKMAVAEESRRRLVGTKLTLAIIEKTKAFGACELYLETHPTFVHAQRLYESLGFKHMESSPIPKRYRRRRVVMKREL
ncbi:MAG: bifunctional helix-turn-helix transcriptional regulator/GNAT family N-acetyltransferase [Planctomycetota bacterium]|jgi:DNA-binding MarR family transcriptional regulator